MKPTLMSVLGFGTSVALGAATASAASIGYEAEWGTPAPVVSHTYNVITDPAASGGEAIEPDGADFGFGTANATMTYVVEFPEAGNYNLFVRLRRATDNTDTFDFRVSTSELRDTPITNGNFVALTGSFASVTNSAYSIVNALQDVTPVSLGFNGQNFYPIAAAGAREFQISNRNDNVIIDAFVFSTESSLTEEQFLAAIIPEPASLALLGLGGLALLVRRHGV